MAKDKRHDDAEKKIKQLGEKLGYAAFTEVKLLNARYSPVVDAVWFNPVYKKLYGEQAKPNNVQETLCPVEVAFEVEKVYQLWNNIQSCIKRIQATGANLGVIVIPIKERIKEPKEKSKDTKGTKGKWGISTDRDIENVREWVSHREQTPRIIVLTLDEIENLL